MSLPSSLLLSRLAVVALALGVGSSAGAKNLDDQQGSHLDHRLEEVLH